ASDDIVWIYIADETSPLDQYASKIKAILRIHYRVSDEQITALRKQFNVDGIPYYILVDRKGKATGRPDLRDHSAFKKAILDEVAR
ncbi:MAG: thioredoxin family protein, partial [Paramuribaculum sp.]|nr:thioredoxin family protein [Paramuribaculum sp.]